MPKGKRTLSPVTRAIQALGMSPKQFVEEKLGIKYPTFQYRVQNGVLRLEDYQRIMYWTGKQFHELWPSEWDQKRHHIPINLGNTSFKNGIMQAYKDNIAALAEHPHNNANKSATVPGSSGYATITLAPSTTARLTPAPQEDKKKEETFSAPPAPEIESPYDGFLPPID